jgi:phospholipid/cholesterol/gamma-HCH transport system permease protein
MQIIEQTLNRASPLLAQLGRFVLTMVAALGKWCNFVWESLQWMVRPPFRMDQYLKQMEFVGVKSTWIIALTSVFTGAVFALQTGRVYALFNMESMVGATVGMSLTREIAPVFAAIMVTARACSAMAAELGTMRVTEQIDALETMAVNPIQYLVVPRIIACTIMVPMLTMLYNFVGVIGSYIVSIHLLGIDQGPFLNKLYHYVDGDDIWGGLIKASVFGFLIAVMSCYMGFNAKGGAKGVGKATTQAVVLSSVTVLITDYFLTTWILEYISR